MSDHLSIPQIIMGNNPALRYLGSRDQYLTARYTPFVTCGIIGTGINGQEHLRNTVFEGRARVKGVFDKDKASAEAAYRVSEEIAPDKPLKIYESIADLCEDPEIEAVMISTPNYTHIDVIKEIMKYNKHIFLEKPMATTIKDAWEIWEFSRNYDPVFQIGLQYRYKSIYKEAIYESRTRKILGDIKTVSISEHRMPFLDKVDQWNKFSHLSGGTLVEKCCHYFDLFNLFADSRPVSVFASGSQAVNYSDFSYEGETSDIIDNAMVIVEYKNGIRANFDLCMFAPLFYEKLVLCGSNGRLSASEKEDFSTQSGMNSMLSIACNDGNPARNIKTFYPEIIENMGHHGATFFEHIRFIDNIVGKTTDSASVEEGFWAVVVGVAAQESISSGKIVNVDELLKSEGISL